MWDAIHRSLLSTQFKIVALITIFLVGAVSCAVREPGEIEGTWIITEAIAPTNNEASINDSQMWLGQSFHYGPENLTLGRTFCKSAEYDETKLSAAEFKQDYNIGLRELDIHDNAVRTVSVTCDEAERLPGQTVLLAASGKAYTVWNGAFYKMEKTPAKTQADGL